MSLPGSMVWLEREARCPEKKSARGKNLWNSQSILNSTRFHLEFIPNLFWDRHDQEVYIFNLFFFLIKLSQDFLAILVLKEVYFGVFIIIKVFGRGDE